MNTKPRPLTVIWRDSDRRVVEAVEAVEGRNHLCPYGSPADQQTQKDDSVNWKLYPLPEEAVFLNLRPTQVPQFSRRSVSMRPQLMDIIVVLIWLSLISISSSQAVVSSDPGENNSSSSTKKPPPSASGQLPSTSAQPIPPHSSTSPDHPSPPLPKDGRGGENPSAKSPGGKTHRSDKGGPASGGEKKQPFGKKLGIWFLGIAGGLQVAAVAFLSFKRRQIPGILEKSGTQLGD